MGPHELAGFTMPRANAMADLMQTAVLAGDFATAETTWNTQWEDTLTTKAWDRWLVGGRLAATGRLVEWSAGVNCGRIAHAGAHRLVSEPAGLRVSRL